MNVIAPIAWYHSMFNAVNVNTEKSSDAYWANTLILHSRGTHILRYTGMFSKNGRYLNGDVPQKWVGFLQEIPRHGSQFSLKKSLVKGPFHNFLGFAKRTLTLKNGSVSVAKSLEMSTYFGKILRNGYLFLEKFTPRYRYGFWVSGGTSPTKPNLSKNPGAGSSGNCKVTNSKINN